jgi:hypothetical protein
MANVVECLPSKNETLTLKPSTAKKKEMSLPLILRENPQDQCGHSPAELVQSCYHQGSAWKMHLKSKKGQEEEVDRVVPKSQLTRTQGCLSQASEKTLLRGRSEWYPSQVWGQETSETQPEITALSIIM